VLGAIAGEQAQQSVDLLGIDNRPQAIIQAVEVKNLCHGDWLGISVFWPKRLP
jgi:hypothetical protein